MIQNLCKTLLRTSFPLKNKIRVQSLNVRFTTNNYCPIIHGSMYFDSTFGSPTAVNPPRLFQLPTHLGQILFVGSYIFTKEDFSRLTETPVFHCPLLRFTIFSRAFLKMLLFTYLAMVVQSDLSKRWQSSTSLTVTDMSIPSKIWITFSANESPDLVEVIP